MTEHNKQSAVVIGGTHGMGMAMTRALIERGYRVLLTGNSEQNLQNARRELGEHAIVLRSDAANMADVRALGETVKSKLGTIHAAFLNVGVCEFAPFEAVTEASYDRQFAINAKGLFFSVQQLAPLVRDGGAMVMTTVTPAVAVPTMSVYNGTKAAVLAFARGFAAELLPRNIRVNCLAPGFIDTPTLGIANVSSEQRAEFRAFGDRRTPMRRLGKAEEVARAAMFLAFEASYTNGVELAIDGGLSELEVPEA